MFNCVGLFWMIETKEQYKFTVDDRFIECCKGGPWFNQRIFQNLHGPIFEYFFVTARQDRYDLMCGLYYYGKIMISQLMKQTLVMEYPDQQILQ